MRDETERQLHYGISVSRRHGVNRAKGRLADKEDCRDKIIDLIENYSDGDRTYEYGVIL